MCTCLMADRSGGRGGWGCSQRGALSCGPAAGVGPGQDAPEGVCDGASGPGPPAPGPAHWADGPGCLGPGPSTALRSLQALPDQQGTCLFVCLFCPRMSPRSI